MPHSNSINLRRKNNDINIATQKSNVVMYQQLTGSETHVGVKLSHLDGKVIGIKLTKHICVENKCH